MDMSVITADDQNHEVIIKKLIKTDLEQITFEPLERMYKA